LPKDPNKNPEFDKLYGESQAFIGEAVLVSEDTQLTEEINQLNEKFYRTSWATLSPEKCDEAIENLKKEATLLIARMREDIKSSTRFEWGDFVHMISGLVSKNKPKR